MGCLRIHRYGAGMSKNKMEVLAIIPARGGSKSILKKNIQDFLGYPLIAYSIVAVKRANLVTRVIVSTDDEEIATIAREYGAEVPFNRPSELAQDDTLDFPVFEHALKWLKEKEDYQADLIVQLRPTSPLRPPNLIDEAVQLLMENPDTDSVRGVVPAGENPYKMWRLAEDGSMQALLTLKGVQEAFNAPRQSLPSIYWQTGHVDIVRSATILGKGSMSGEKIRPIHIDAAYSVDIDTLSDLKAAEALASSGDLDLIWPGKQPRPFPSSVKMLVLDFDGVITDDRVWVDDHGNEQVAANRGDGMGIALLKKAGVEIFVLSSEKNPVVAARCAKLDIPVKQGLKEKGSVLDKLLKERNIDASEVIFVGNDVNDLECFHKVGFAAVPNDAHVSVLREADLRLKKRGGHGAVREVCDLIIEAQH
jgi:YrbI family 3-deoxy-D-manno-octulosonate 8-phosphate phosphatase